MWKQLVLVRLRHGMVCAVLCTLRTAYSQLTAVIDAIDEALTDSGASTVGSGSGAGAGAGAGGSAGAGSAGAGAGGGGGGGGAAAGGMLLPVEEPPVLLRHYTGHDTVMFVYVHVSTHVCVAPPPRPVGTHHPTALPLFLFCLFFFFLFDVYHFGGI